MAFLLTFLKSNWKLNLILPIVIAIAFGVWKYKSIQDEYKELQTTYNTLKETYDNLNTAYTKLQAAVSFQQAQIQSTSILLDEAYKNVDKRTQDMLEIDTIMNSKEPVDTSTEETTDTKEETYEPVTSKQNVAGIEFMHRQFSTLQ